MSIIKMRGFLEGLIQTDRSEVVQVMGTESPGIDMQSKQFSAYYAEEQGQAGNL